MDGYELIMTIQKKMQNPEFARKFNNLTAEFNSVPGLQQEVMRIVQIQDEHSRKKAMEKLPSKAKKLVKEMFSLING
ncbi:MAG: hypothetical protein ACRDA5_04130 [Clostridium sp.]